MIVKGAGHDEEEINEELERIKNGESWVGFDNLPIGGAIGKSSKS